MKKIYISLLVLPLLLYACKLEEGEGGQGEISGKVMVQVWVSRAIIGKSDTLINEYPSVDERVYIKYGDNSIYDDDFKTDAGGNYKFTGLVKGDYTISTYSYCDTCDTKVDLKEQKINLSSHKEKIAVPTFYIKVKK